MASSAVEEDEGEEEADESEELGFSVSVVTTTGMVRSVACGMGKG